jgi:membrane associated rhomboid family serine protease
MSPSLLRHAPITLATALAALIGTLLLHDHPSLWNPATTWTIHADPHHLVCDLVGLISLGLWLEPRIGSTRLGLWLVAAIASSMLLHCAVYSDQAWLFGLSAIDWFLAAAGLCAVATRRARALLIPAALLLLAHECGGDGSGILTVLGKSAAADLPLIRGVEIRPVPWVHAATAATGALVGLVYRTRQRPHPVAAGTPTAARSAELAAPPGL